MKDNAYDCSLDVDIKFNTAVTATNTWYPLFSIPDNALPSKAKYFTVYTGATPLEAMISISNKYCAVRLNANISANAYINGYIKYDK